MRFCRVQAKTPLKSTITAVVGYLDLVSQEFRKGIIVELIDKKQNKASA
jgi:hypothetical protein